MSSTILTHYSLFTQLRWLGSLWKFIIFFLSTVTMIRYNESLAACQGDSRCAFVSDDQTCHDKHDDECDDGRDDEDGASERARQGTMQPTLTLQKISIRKRASECKLADKAGRQTSEPIHKWASKRVEEVRPQPAESGGGCISDLGPPVLGGMLRS